MSHDTTSPWSHYATERSPEPQVHRKPRPYVATVRTDPHKPTGMMFHGQYVYKRATDTGLVMAVLPDARLANYDMSAVDLISVKLESTSDTSRPILEFSLDFSEAAGTTGSVRHGCASKVMPYVLMSGTDRCSPLSERALTDALEHRGLDDDVAPFEFLSGADRQLHSPPVLSLPETSPTGCGSRRNSATAPSVHYHGHANGGLHDPDGDSSPGRETAVGFSFTDGRQPIEHGILCWNDRVETVPLTAGSWAWLTAEVRKRVRKVHMPVTRPKGLYLSKIDVMLQPDEQMLVRSPAVGQRRASCGGTIVFDP